MHTPRYQHSPPIVQAARKLTRYAQQRHGVREQWPNGQQSMQFLSTLVEHRVSKFPGGVLVRFVAAEGSTIIHVLRARCSWTLLASAYQVGTERCSVLSILMRFVSDCQIVVSCFTASHFGIDSRPGLDRTEKPLSRLVTLWS